MRPEWIWMTHNGTGGTGSLTLVDVAGWPGFEKFAAAGLPRRVEYTILEFTDSTLSVLKQAETGIGNFDPSANLLTRDIVTSTWSGTVMIPNQGSASAAAALTIGATAANVRVTCAPTPNLLPAIPLVGSSVSGSDNAGTLPLNFTSAGAASLLLTSGQVEIIPILLAHRGPFSQITLNVGGGSGTYSGGTQSLTAAIYEIETSDGLPGRKLVDFGAIGGSTPFAVAGNVSNTPLAQPVPLETGWYYLAILAQFSGGSGTPRMKGGSALGASPFGSRITTGAIVACEGTVSGQTSLTDPATNTGFGLSNNGYFWAALLA